MRVFYRWCHAGRILSFMETMTTEAAMKKPFDVTLVAISIGLALWFMCATMVISTFVHPGASPRVPAVNPHGGHTVLIAGGEQQISRN